MTRSLFLAVPLLLVACTPAQLLHVQTTEGRIAAAVETGCSAVEAAATVAAPFAAVPQIGSLLTFATAACGGASAVAGMIDKAVQDPETVAWLERLRGQITATVTAVRG